MLRILIVSLLLARTHALEMVLSFPDGLSDDSKRSEIRLEIEKIIRSQGGQLTKVLFREDGIIKETRKQSVSYVIVADSVDLEGLRSAFMRTFPDKHLLGDIGVSKSAQQGDAPEPATDADPASRPPSAPAR